MFQFPLPALSTVRDTSEPAQPWESQSVRERVVALAEVPINRKSVSSRRFH